MRPVILSERLRTVASMVTRGMRVCDVGCDHGFVSVWLVEQKISPGVLAMDVREGPLAAARRHVAERGLESSIETRLSDGLHNYKIGEADSLVCAGMGGRLMTRILGEEKAKTDSFRELVLQPQSELEQFRRWLREHGYRITAEKMVEEDGKFYPMMRAVPESGEDCPGTEMPPEKAEPGSTAGDPGNGGREEEPTGKLSDRYGGFLLRQGDAVLRTFLRKEERTYEEILARLQAQGFSGGKRKRRYEEVELLLEGCRAAQKIAAYPTAEL